MSGITVVGMNNPQSTRPEHALWTQPDGCTGHRLWLLATSLTGISQEDWLAVADRRNLCVGEWSREAARAQADAWREELADRTVIMLGSEVLCTMRDWNDPADRLLRPLEWHHSRDWFLLPHPSGLNRWYNCQVSRMAAQIRLRDVLAAHGHTATEEESVDGAEEPGARDRALARACAAAPYSGRPEPRQQSLFADLPGRG